MPQKDSQLSGRRFKRKPRRPVRRGRSQKEFRSNFKKRRIEAPTVERKEDGVKVSHESVADLVYSWWDQSFIDEPVFSTRIKRLHDLAAIEVAKNIRWVKKDMLEGVHSAVWDKVLQLNVDTFQLYSMFHNLGKLKSSQNMENSRKKQYLLNSSIPGKVNQRLENVYSNIHWPSAIPKLNALADHLIMIEIETPIPDKDMLLLPFIKNLAVLSIKTLPDNVAMGWANSARVGKWQGLKIVQVTGDTSDRAVQHLLAIPSLVYLEATQKLPAHSWGLHPEYQTLRRQPLCLKYRAVCGSTSQAMLEFRVVNEKFQGTVTDSLWAVPVRTNSRLFGYRAMASADSVKPKQPALPIAAPKKPALLRTNVSKFFDI